MKKLKFIPSIIMLVLCVGVLAIGVFAVKPTQNAISGSITISATNNPVKLEVFIDSTSTSPIKTYPEVRGGEQIKLDDILGASNALAFNTSQANELHEVPAKKIIVRVTNLATSARLGAYYCFCTHFRAMRSDLGTRILCINLMRTRGWRRLERQSLAD